MANTDLPRVSARNVIPGSVLVVAPAEIQRDELRLARLDEYLQAEFPELEFTLAEHTEAGIGQGIVGIVPTEDGASPYDEAGTREVVGRVIDAVQVFLNYGDRRH